MTPIVIIHGWSDNSSSFEHLAKRLRKETNRTIKELWLADYVSLDDDVTMKDIVSAMQSAWNSSGLPNSENSVDVIVHSTGGLVIRDWMSSYWPDGQKPPVRNLVMLAPANFGSPLAHKGRSIIGRVVKGWGADKTFQTGEHILKALEMASPYSWHLAEKDRFGLNAFNQGGVRCTVIAGNKGYTGISALANEDGTDGTVYVSTANLNCARININVSREKGRITATAMQLSKGKAAFLILDGFDHSKITGSNSLPKKLLNPILDALNVTKSKFSQWCKQCDKQSELVREKYTKTKDPEHHAFQNTVFHVVDDSGASVDDYVIEFFGNFQDRRDKWATMFSKRISKKIHAYSDDCSYRSFMIDTTSIDQLIDKVDETLKFSLSALPDVNDHETLVGYKSFGVNDIGMFELKQVDIKKYFSPDRTLFVTITLPRYQKNKVFNIKHMQ